MFEQVVSAPRRTIVHFVRVGIQGGERESSRKKKKEKNPITKGQEVQV